MLAGIGVALRDILRRALGQRPSSPYIAGNRIEVLVDGGPFYRALIEAIETSERYVFMESYIVAADQTGWRVAHALAERSRAGVEVAFSIDGYGSIALDTAYVDHLREAGVKVSIYRPISIVRGRLPWRRRNHRKMLVADGRIGIVGGMNISNDYAAVDDGGHGWRDTAVRVEGPAVAALESMFRRLWVESGGVDLQSVHVAAPAFPGGDEVRFLANFGRRDRSFVRRAYLLAIVAAERSIRIMNAYFLPDRVLLRALVRAAKRGVKVEIIVAGATDVKVALYATRSLYGRFLANGIQVYEWCERILHAKVAVIDGQWTTIGSSNLDALSSFRNLEVNAGILGARIGAAMEDQFEVDRARSNAIVAEEWRKRPLWMKVIEAICGLLRKIS